jgi:hypothetical protein
MPEKHINCFGLDKPDKKYQCGYLLLSPFSEKAEKMKERRFHNKLLVSYFKTLQL